MDDCGINRNTFYYHFEDIHALLAYLVDAEVQRVIEKHSDVQSMEEGFIEAANFALSNKRAVYHIYNSVSREELERYLNGIAQEVIRRMIDGLDLDKDVPEADRELLIHFYKCGMVGLVTGWLNEGMKTDPEQMIRSLGALLDGSVAAALQRSRERAQAARSI